MNQTVISTDNLSKSFGTNQALKAVTLSVQQGTTTGLVGPNGAGKTTLFSLLCGFLKPTQVYIQSKKPKYIWREKFYLDQNLSKFLYDGNYPHLIYLNIPIDYLQSWMEAENQVKLVLDQFGLVIKEVNYNPAGGWHLITSSLRINFGDDLSNQSYKKLSRTLKYMFENDLTPSIIDLRYKAGAALNYG